MSGLIDLTHTDPTSQNRLERTLDTIRPRTQEGSIQHPIDFSIENTINTPRNSRENVSRHSSRLWTQYRTAQLYFTVEGSSNKGRFILSLQTWPSSAKDKLSREQMTRQCFWSGQKLFEQINAEHLYFCKLYLG